MARKTLIKMRRKPGKKPERKTNIKETLSLDYLCGHSLKDILENELLKQIPVGSNIDLKDVILNYDYDGWEAGRHYHFSWTRSETDEEYNERLKKWQNIKNKYDRWYEDNKELIEKELELRENDKQVKLERELEHMKQQKEKLLKDIEKIHRKLK